MLQSVPTADECAAAVQRATNQRANDYRQTQPTLTAASIAERVTGIVGQPVEEEDGWWCVGIVNDAISDQLLDVLYRPRRLATRQQREPEIEAREPSFGRFYNDGTGWRDRETGDLATSPEIKRYLGMEPGP